MNTCADCKWYRVNPNDLRSGICFNRPPECALIPGAGQMPPQTISYRPPVTGTDAQCSEFSLKIVSGSN